VGPGDTGFCVGLVEPDSERTFVTSPGVESELTADHLEGVAVRADDALYVSGYDLCYPVTGPTVAAWCIDLADSLLVLDPGPLAAEIPPRVLDPVLDRTDVLTLNGREAGLLAGLPDVDEAGDALRDRLHPSAVLIVRQGARGCTLYLPGYAEPQHIPAPAVTAVDSTGAFLAELHRTGSTPESARVADAARIVDAARVANAAAALAVTRAGSATGPGRGELDRLLDSWDIALPR
jgi:sugar/nucleoside kinase (ribokinase family)